MEFGSSGRSRFTASTARWGEDAPPSAVKTVQVHVSRLRKALGEAEIVATTPAGYRLRVLPGELDAERFARLVDEGRRALTAGQAEEAATVLRDALTLWRRVRPRASPARPARRSWPSTHAPGGSERHRQRARTTRSQ
jgi:hypothetical protein